MRAAEKQGRQAMRFSGWVFLPLLFAATGASAQLLKPDFKSPQKYWIEDTEKHCWFADPDPAPGETVAWSGPACNGALAKGEGELVWTRDGKVFERDAGIYDNGMLAGQGSIQFEDGAKYVGLFPGDGVLTLPDGQRFAAISVKEIAGWSIEQDPRRIAPLP
jgi:hypothetical protein